jgi:mannose-1-phosphate guanylyltransferase / phosphomannomutase
MKAMLIAAGRGTRLRPLTDSTPKCMLQFQGKPLLAHWLDKLRVIGITEVVINVHHLADQIMNYFGTGEQWGLNIRYSPEKDLLGTAGAVRQARSILDGVEFHASHCSIATMSACWIEDPRSCGIVGFDESGRIERFLEKPTSEQIFSHYINAGIYVFEPEIFEYIPAEGECDFSRDVFPAMLVRKAPLYAYSYNGYVLKFDTFEDWKRSEAIVRDHELAGKPGTQVTV